MSSNNIRKKNGNNRIHVPPVVWALSAVVVVLYALLTFLLLRGKQLDNSAITDAPTPRPASSHIHTWKPANCRDPETCSVCGATQGDPLGHDWAAATCTQNGYCRICGATGTSASGHKWEPATCTAAETCSACGATQGNALGHSWTEATYHSPKTCKRCNATEGDVRKRVAKEVPVIQEANGTKVYWSVQVSSSGSEKNSRIVAERMREAGYNAFVYHRPNSKTFKIMLGLFATKPDANSSAEIIRNSPQVKGLKDISDAYAVDIMIASEDYDNLVDTYM